MHQNKAFRKYKRTVQFTAWQFMWVITFTRHDNELKCFLNDQHMENNTEDLRKTGASLPMAFPLKILNKNLPEFKTQNPTMVKSYITKTSEHLLVVF